MKTTILAAFAAAVGAAQPSPAGSSLIVRECDPSNEAQQFNVNGSTVTAKGSGLCVTAPPGAPGSVTLNLQPCQSLASQLWKFNPQLGGVFEGQPDGVCLAWNVEGGNGVEGINSTIGLWPCDQLGFNSYFGVSPAGQISMNFTSPSNSTSFGLCIEAVPPPPLPMPTASQIAWQEDGDDIACFVHFNMATAAGTQGCNCASAPPDSSIWNPSALNTDEWISTGVSMGCSRFVYTAKHNCGFLTWASNATSYPWGTYNYSIAFAPNKTDVVASFVNSAKKAGVGYGFYYSTVTNALMNVCSGSVGANAGPGQIPVTQAQYDSLVLDHLRELWTAYGPLREVWFDGSYQPELAPQLRELFATLQPNVIAYQGAGLMPSPVRWVGSESGLAPYPCWSTAAPGASGGGDPNGAAWIPAETDFTLQNYDNWFYNEPVGVHSPAELRNMLETSLGHNTALIIDIAPKPDGSVPPEQVAAAASLGAFMRGCYGNPVASTSGSGVTELNLRPSNGSTTIDRIRIREDIARGGQTVRAFSITATLEDGSLLSVFNGTSIGAKFITVLPEALTVTEVTLTVQSVAANAPTSAPFIKGFDIFSCNALAESIDAQAADA